jgi:hypothetical protein
MMASGGNCKALAAKFGKKIGQVGSVLPAGDLFPACLHASSQIFVFQVHVSKAGKLTDTFACSPLSSQQTIPDTWRKGVHYNLVEYNTFTVGEVVVVSRSNGMVDVQEQKHALHNPLDLVHETHLCQISISYWNERTKSIIRRPRTVCLICFEEFDNVGVCGTTGSKTFGLVEKVNANDTLDVKVGEQGEQGGAQFHRGVNNKVCFPAMCKSDAANTDAKHANQNIHLWGRLYATWLSLEGSHSKHP